MADTNAALAGLRVLELAHVVAGPLAGGLMADLGADVVHVEPPITGDAARQMGPAKDGVHLWWKVSGRNKRSIALDLRTRDGQMLARQLVERADVVICGLRADTLERWRLDWPHLRQANPRLIMLQISGFGALSSKRSAPGFGKVGEARSGVVQITGFQDTPPVHTGFSHGDAVTGLMGAFAVMSALYRRDRDPDFGGEWIDLALFESLFRLIEWQVIVYDQLGLVPERAGNRLPVAPGAVINSYKSSDGHWLTITSATPKSVINVVRMIGLDEADYQTVERQEKGRELLDDLLCRWVASRTCDVCLHACEEHHVVASRIFTMKDIAEDSIYAELGSIIEVDDFNLGRVRMQGVIPRLQQHPGKIWRTGPRLGEDTDYVLRTWLGLTREEIEALQTRGVLACDAI